MGLKIHNELWQFFYNTQRFSDLQNCWKEFPADIDSRCLAHFMCFCGEFNWNYGSYMCAKSHRVSSHVSFLFRPKSKSTSLWKSWKVDFWKEHVKCRFSKTCHDNERNGKPCLPFFFFFVYMYQFKRILRTIAIKNWLPALISANSRHSSQQVLHKTSGCSKINLFYMCGCMKAFFSTQRWKRTVLYVCTRTHYTCYL